jgi:hypothetical protein
VRIGRRLKTFLKLASLGLLLFWPPAYFYLEYYAKLDHQQSLEKQSQDTQAVVVHTQNLLKNGMGFEACEFLQDKATNQKIVGFNIKAEGIQCRFPASLEEQKFAVREPNQVHRIPFENRSLEYLKFLEGDTEVLLIQQPVSFHSLWEVLLRNPFNLATTLFVDSLLAFWIVFVLWMMWVVRNLEKVKAIYRKSEFPIWLKPFELVIKPFQLDQEEQIYQMQKSASVQLEQIEKEKVYRTETLEYVTLDDLLKENQTTPIQFPIQFKGVVVRVDINSYSSLIYQGNRKHLAELKKVFDWTAAECAYRYRGLFEGRAGDEVVYCFKDEGASLRAVAFLRDFMSQISGQDFEFHNQKPTRLFVKASIAASELTMEASPSKFDFDGDALYFTNRMFGELPHKEENILIAFPDYLPEISRLVQAAFETREITNKEAHLTVSYIKSFKDFQQALAEDPMLSKYFLSDEDLIQQMQYLTDSQKNIYERLVVARLMYGHLRIRKTNALPAKAWIQGLSAMDVQDDKAHELCAIYLGLGSHLVQKDVWSRDVTNSVIEFALAGDQRSQANAVEVLSKWNDFPGVERLMTSLRHRSVELAEYPRTQANYLMAKGVHLLSEDVFEELIQLMRKRDTNIRLSAIYAATQLILHYQELNFAKLASYGGYMRLRKQLVRSQVHMSPRVHSFYSRIHSHAY